MFLIWSDRDETDEPRRPRPPWWWWLIVAVLVLIAGWEGILPRN